MFNLSACSPVGYRIRVTVASNGNRQQFTTSHPSNYNVTSLQAYTRYIVTMAARTVNGTGPYSFGYEVVTSEAAPSRPPSNLRHTEQTSSTLELGWDLPARQFWNGIIRHYRVEMTEVETAVVRVFTSTISSLRLSTLHPNYHYRFRVAIVTVEPGPFSAILSVQLPEAGELT